MENRPLSELWRIVLDKYQKQDKYLSLGLCEVIMFLRIEGAISVDEEFIIKQEIREKADSMGRNILLRLWDKNDTQSRIDFMNSRIIHHEQLTSTS